MKVPEDVLFMESHEWARRETQDTVTVGISDYAQDQLGDVVFVELPAAGKKVTKGGEAAVVESVKAASEVYAPLTGEVVETNVDLEAAPGTVNDDPHGKGWFFKMKLSDMGELDGLMDEAGYKSFVEGL